MGVDQDVEAELARRRRIGDALRGRPKTPEHRAALADAARKHWESRHGDMERARRAERMERVRRALEAQP